MPHRRVSAAKPNHFNVLPSADGLPYSIHRIANLRTKRNARSGDSLGRVIARSWDRCRNSIRPKL